MVDLSALDNALVAATITKKTRSIEETEVKICAANEPNENLDESTPIAV